MRADKLAEALREKTFSTGNPFCPVDSKSMREVRDAAPKGVIK